MVERPLSSVSLEFQTTRTWPNWRILIGLSLDELLMSLRTKFLDRYGYQTENRKDLSLSAIFLIYSVFSNKIQMSLFSRKAYDKLIAMTGKQCGVPMLGGELWPFCNWQSSISRQIRHVFQCTCARARATRTYPARAPHWHAHRVCAAININSRYWLTTAKLLFPLLVIINVSWLS